MANRFTIATRFQGVDNVSSVAKKINGNIAAYSDRARRSFAGIGGAASRLTSILRTAAIVLTTGAIAKAVTDFADRAHDAKRTAALLGLSTSALQEYQYAAKFADVDAESLTSAFEKMNKNLGSAAGKQAIFTALVRSGNRAQAVQLLHTKDTAGRFNVLIEALGKTKDPATRAALAVAAFGKAGQVIIPMAAEGAAGLAKLREEAHKAGFVIDNETTKASEDLSDSLKRTKAMLQGFANIALGAAVKALAPLLAKLTAWVLANRELIGQKIEKTIENISKAISDAYNIVTKLNDMMHGNLVRNLLIAVATYKSLAVAIGIAKTAQVAFNLVSGGAAAGAAKTAASTIAADGLGTVGAGAASWAGKWGAAAVPTLAAVAGPAALGIAGGLGLGTMIGKKITDALGLTQKGDSIIGSMIKGSFLDPNQKQHVQIDFTNLPAGVTIQQNGKMIGGAKNVTLPLGRSAGRDAWH